MNFQLLYLLSGLASVLFLLDVLVFYIGVHVLRYTRVLLGSSASITASMGDALWVFMTWDWSIFHRWCNVSVGTGVSYTMA